MEGSSDSSVSEAAQRQPNEVAAVWSVPTWVRHPRLEGILGCRLTDLGWTELEALVKRKVPEDLSIDFKQSHYILDRGIGRAVMSDASTSDIDERIAKDRFELAKDLSSFANAAGGLLIIGVGDKDGRATGFAEVALSDKVRLTYLDVLRGWISPYLSGVEIGHVESPTSPGVGCVLIFVPPSADRPHAVVEPNSHRFTWYLRDGAHGVQFSEAQVAVAYRDRFAGRDEVERRVHSVFGQGVEELNRQERVWLAAAVVPAQGAPRRHLDRALLDGFKAQVQTRQDRLPGARLGHHAAFGRGRVVLRDAPQSVTFATDHLLHLYVDGSAFAAVALDTLHDPADVVEGRPELEFDVRCIRVGSLTTWAIALTGLVCGHAVDVGAAGNLELICGIVTAVQEDPDLFAPETTLPPLQHVILDQPMRFSPRELMIPGSTWRTSVSPVHLTVSAIAANDTRELLTVSAQLVNEIVAEFGHLPSDPLLTANGLVVGEHCQYGRLEPLRDWARWEGVLAEEQGVQT